MPAQNSDVLLIERDGVLYKASAAEIAALGGGGQSIFPIWAEENGLLQNDSYEWSFGNGAEGLSGGGVVLPFDCELIAMTAKTGDGIGDSEIQAVISGVPQASYTVQNSSGKGSIRFAIPLPIVADSTLNFLTLRANQSGNHNIACAWLRLT